MPCFHPTIAWRPPPPLEDDVFVRKDGKRIESSRKLLFHPPIGAYRQTEYQVVYIPCGRCLGCRERDARSWSIRLTCEAQLHAENSFITLTYSPATIPKNWSLDKREVQLFMKKLRFRFPDNKLRYFLCGEYSPAGRPHYHLVLHGLAFFEDRKPAGKSGTGHDMFTSPTLDSIWGNGRAVIQALTPETAAYAARYTNKKVDGERERFRIFPDGRRIRIQREFLLMSRRPGLGSTWISRFHSDVYKGDEGAFISRGGAAVAPPRYFDRWLESNIPEQYAAVKAKREQYSNQVEVLSERAPIRLASREAVEKARHGSQRVARDAI